MKRASQRDDDKDEDEGGLVRGGVHPLERDSCYDSLWFFTDSSTMDWKLQVDPDDEYLRAWHICIQPLLCYPREPELLKALKQIDDIDSNAVEIHKRRVLLEDRVSSPLLKDLLFCYRMAPYGIGMMKEACKQGMEDSLFYLEQCGLPLEQFMETLVELGKDRIVKRLLDRRSFLWYPPIRTLHRTPVSTLGLLFRHRNVRIYFKEESAQLVDLMTLIAMMDEIELFDFAVQQGFPVLEHKDSILHDSLRGYPHYRVLIRLLHLGADQTPDCYVTLQKLMTMPMCSPIGLETVLRQLPQQPPSSSLYVRLFEFAALLPNHGFYELMATYLVPFAVPHMGSEQQLVALDSLRKRCLEYGSMKLFEVLYRAMPPLDDAVLVNLFEQKLRPTTRLSTHFMDVFVRLDVDVGPAIHRFWSGLTCGTQFWGTVLTAFYWFQQLEPYYHRPLSKDLYAFFLLLFANSGKDDARAFVRRFVDHDPDGLLCEWLLNAGFALDLVDEFRLDTTAAMKGVALELIDEFNLDATVAIETLVKRRSDPYSLGEAVLSYYKDKPDKGDQYVRYCQAVVRSFQNRQGGRDVLCELRDAAVLPAEFINIRVTRSVANRVKK